MKKKKVEIEVEDTTPDIRYRFREFLVEELRALKAEYEESIEEINGMIESLEED